MNTSGANRTLQATGVLTLNQFQHVAVTYSKASGEATLYVDGVAVATAALGSSNLRTDADLHIGRRPDGSFTPPVATFNGLIDEVRIYSRALSWAEIGAQFDQGHGSPVPVRGCRTLEMDNVTYEITDNLVAAPGANCLDITSDNATLDGKGFTVTGTPGSGGALGEVGVKLTDAQGTTLTDFRVTGFKRGIMIGSGILGSSGNTVTEVAAEDNALVGIYVRQTTGNTIIKNIVSSQISNLSLGTTAGISVDPCIAKCRGGQRCL